jgi:hypothetical protein
MNRKQKQAKLERAYALLISYDYEYGTDEILDEVAELVRSVIGKRAERRAQSRVDGEYSGSGMSPNEG